MSKRRIMHKVVILLLCIALSVLSLVACDSGADVKINFYLGNELYCSVPVVDGEFTMPKPPKVNGQTFAGWYLDAQFSKAYDLTFTADSRLSEGADLYAKFLQGEVEDCLITLQPNNGEEAINFELTDKNFIFPTILRAGYSFDGWYNDEEFGSVWDSFDSLSTGDILYAKWAYILPNVLINYITNGGSEVMSQYADVGSIIEEPDCTRDMYNLVGWFADKDCTVLWNFDTDTVLATTTLYAKWVEKNHIVTVYGRGNIVLESYAVEHGDIVKPLPIMDDDVKFAFLGWYADATGLIALDINQPILSDIFVWSKWREKTPQVAINYIIDGESVAQMSNDKSAKISQPYVAKAYDDLSFFGWYTDVSMTKLWDFRAGIVSDTTNLFGKYLSPTVGLEYSLNYDDTYTVTGYQNSTTGECIVLPEMREGKKVCYIGKNAFANVMASKVLISRNIVNIGDNAFYSATNLDTIYIPSSVKYISPMALANLNSLAHINLDSRSDNYTMLEDALYTGDYKQLLVYTAKSQRHLVNIHESTLYISDYAFAEADNLKRIQFNNRLQGIGNSAFSGCDSLETLSFTAKLGSIGNACFKDCVSLNKIELPTMLGSIGKEAFRGCDNINELILPKSCDIIGEMAFFGLSRIEKINISTAITAIEKRAFDDCSATIFIDSPSLPRGWKTDWSNSVNVKFTDGRLSTDGIWQYTQSGGNATISAYFGTDNMVVIPYEIDGYKVVGMGAIFAGNIVISRVVIEAELTEILANTFNGANRLGSIILPNQLEYIGAYAFNKCSSLASLSLSAGVKEVGDNAFSNCSSLQRVNLSVAMTTLATNAFANCTMLANIKLNDSLKYIGEGAFYNCSSLMSITWNNNLLAIGKGAFVNCNNIKSLTLPDSLKSLADNAFQDCTGLTNVYIPKLLHGIGVATFSGCSNITKVTFALNSNLTKISARAFEGCTALTKLDLPSKLTVLDDRAFFRAISLNKVTFGNQLIKIGSRAFEDCQLSNIILPNTVLYVGDFAFMSCPLQYAVLGGAIAKLTATAFSGTPHMTIFIQGVRTNYWDNGWSSGKTVVLDGHWQFMDGVPVIIK